MLDVLINRLGALLAEYEVTGDRRLLFGAEADGYAESLGRAVSSVDRATASTPLIALFRQGSGLLAELHCARHTALPGSAVHLARAVAVLAPVAADPRLVPGPLKALLGRDAEDAAQAETGRALLRATGSDPALVDAGIALMAVAAARRPGDASRQAFLCLGFRRRFERDGTPDDLDRAVEAGERGAAASEDAVAWLVSALLCRYIEKRRPDDLRRTIRLAEGLAQASAEVSADLGMAYRLLFEHGGDPLHLDVAAARYEEALTAAGGVRPAWWSGLSTVLLRRYERTGVRADLDRAADLADLVVKEVPPDDPDRGVHLVHAAAVALLRRDLHRAVELGEEALGTLPEDDRRRPAILRGLADALHRRWLATGSRTDLDRAVTLADWAFKALSAEHPEHPSAASMLAVVHLARFSRDGVLADVQQAIALGEDVIRAEPNGPVGRWSLLGEAYRRRFQVDGADADLQRAIDHGEHAVAATAPDDAALAGRLAELATAYWTRYLPAADGSLGRQDHRSADLERAIELGERAVARTSQDDPGVAEREAGLAAALLARYQDRGAGEDLDAAVALAERAWIGLPDTHPDRPLRAAGLCRAYLVRLNAGGAAPTAERLDELAAAGDVLSAASPAARVAALHACGLLAFATGAYRKAAALLDAAAALIPSVAPREAGWADQQHRIGEHAGLVSAGVAAHCAAGDPAGAVEFAELGRGVLLSAQAGIRTDIGELHERDPELAGRFAWVCGLLATPGFSLSERRDWWVRHDALVSRIRAVTGMEGFLAAPRLVDLQTVVSDGTVVLINAAEDRGDAVLIRADRPPFSVPLPELRHDMVRREVEAIRNALFKDGVLRTPLVRGKLIGQVLERLWCNAVGPVVEALGPSQEPQRVWWMPTGMLGLLPLHAAQAPGGPGALDVMVSSFVPSLRGLRDTRTRPPARSRTTLSVILEKTSGQSLLRGAAAEASVLQGAVLQGSEATADAVLATLGAAAWAHFACHGVVELSSPADSGLMLHDRTLTLPEIGGLRLSEAELAYLSACSTADHGVRYADETLHLASAFQLAGFRHVIASLWLLDDEAAVAAATDFYTALPAAPVADGAAAVLREVTLRLRDTRPDRPDLWAPLVHSGP